MDLNYLVTIIACSILPYLCPFLCNKKNDYKQIMKICGQFELWYYYFMLLENNSWEPPTSTSYFYFHCYYHHDPQNPTPAGDHRVPSQDHPFSEQHLARRREKLFICLPFHDIFDLFHILLIISAHERKKEHLYFIFVLVYIFKMKLLAYWNFPQYREHKGGVGSYTPSHHTRWS